MNDFKKHIAINKTAWNKKTPIHIASDFYNNTEFKNGKTDTYNHDKVLAIMKDSLEAMACWAKYKSYTSSNNLPLSVRNEDIS